jgi:murein DD-endopeptidase MepM/ murein hydrolase activator NlpD
LSASDSRMTREQMAAWNQSHSYKSADWLPGSQQSSGFALPYERVRVGSGDYLTYLHTGVDRVGAGDVVSAGYYEVLEVQDANRVVLGRVGTDSRTRIVHLADTSDLSVGKVLVPGERVGTPANTQPSTGTHVHIEESVVVNGIRVFANPDSHEAVPVGTEFYWQVERQLPFLALRKQGPTYVTITDVASLAPRH